MPKAFIQMMSVKSEVKELLICSVKPHKSVTSDTFSRWENDELCRAVVGISVYKAHRGSFLSLNKAGDIVIFLQNILKRICWKSESVKNFIPQRYNKWKQNIFENVKSLYI